MPQYYELKPKKKYKYSDRSLSKLNTAHPLLQKVFHEAIKHRDLSIIEGHRTKDKQDEYYNTGKSKKRYPNSKHNKMPSLAVDALPYPFKSEDWNDREKFIEFASWIRGLAAGMGITLRCGIDWDMDHDTKDQTFFDGPHFELMVEEE